MLSVQLVGDKELIARLQSAPEAVRKALVRKSYQLAIALQRKIRTEKLSGQVLNKRTGALQSSIFYEVTETQYGVIAKVAAGKDVPYAAIHEYGGTTKPHVIEATKAQALHFHVGGKEVFAKRVNHPGSRMPERSYMRSSLGEMHEQIVEGLTEAVKEGMKATLK